MPRSSGKVADKPNGQSRAAKEASQWEYFLTSLVEHAGNVTRACEDSKINRTSVYMRRSTDDEFERRFQAAKMKGVDVLEDEAVRRAFEGVDEPVGFYLGVSQEVKTNYSDALIQFLLKANRPEKYKERSSVETVDRTASEALAGIDLGKLSGDKLSQLRSILSEARASSGPDLGTALGTVKLSKKDGK